ncbi:MAG: DUF916 domain-containing protein [Coriobacteriia bacterium]|nr:DUF916 domain-containing protein [Coriobacteriia bacterium]
MKYIRFFTFMFVLFIILCAAVFPCVASAGAAEQPMSVKPILPENQKAGVTGYFNLLVNSGDKQTIYMQITNNKKENIVVTCAPANAYTRPEGGIFYAAEIDSPETILLDKFFVLSNYILTDNEVIIKPNETVNIPVEVTVPDMQSGSILGGVLISEKAPASEDVNEDVKEETKKDEAKFKVITKTVFAVAIQLDLPDMPAPAFTFGKAGFNPVGPNVFIEMRNDAQMIQRQISGVYKVTNKDGQELFAGKFEPIIMAPKTQINFPMHWDNPALEPGKYTLSITANVAGEERIVEESFNINNTAVEKYAEQANQSIAKTQTGTLYFIVILGVVILGGFMFWLGKRKAKVKKL